SSYSQNGLTQISSSSKIYLLDTRNYTWVDKFEPMSIYEPIPSNTSFPNSPSTITTTSSLKSNDVVIDTLCGILVTAIFMTIGFIGYKWYQKRKQRVICGVIRD
ncbi:5002_t:CDS:1, partial [Funneliformis caledonium]